MGVVRVLVVDDSAPWRWVVSAILQRSSCCKIVGEAFDGAQAVQKSIELQPDVVLLDIGLPYLNGLEAARQIRTKLRNCKIVLISELMTAWAMSSMVGVDVHACLCKCELVNDLLSTVEGLLAGWNRATDGMKVTAPHPSLEPSRQPASGISIN